MYYVYIYAYMLDIVLYLHTISYLLYTIICVPCVLLESPTLFGSDAISRCQPPKSFVAWQRASRRNGWRWPRVATWSSMTWCQVLLGMGMSRK